MTKTYDIVFSGETMPEIPLETAKHNLARLLKAERTAIDELFERGEVTLKRSVAEADAERYLLALRQAGVLAFKTLQPAPALALALDVEPAPAASPAPAAPAAAVSPTARDAMCCPKCGESQPKAEVCSGCGVVIEKFLAIKARETAEPATPAESPYAPPSAVLDEHLPEHCELKVFSAEGRIGRLRYIAWTTALTLVTGLAIVPLIGVMQSSTTMGIILIGMVLVATAVTGILTGIKRLHDIGWSGWMTLLNLVPLVGNIFPIVLMVAPGTEGTNRYGPPPPPNSTAVKGLAGLLAGIIVVGILAAVLVPILK